MGELEKKPEWGRVLLQGLKWFGVGLGLIMMMMGVGAVLLVGFLIYACGHH